MQCEKRQVFEVTGAIEFTDGLDPYLVSDAGTFKLVIDKDRGAYCHAGRNFFH